MTWQAKVLSLLSGITDPELRLVTARDVFFLLQLYDEGRIGYEELKQELTDIFRDIIAAKHPELTEEEVAEKAEKLAEDIIREYRIKTSFKRIQRRYATRREV